MLVGEKGLREGNSIVRRTDRSPRNEFPFLGYAITHKHFCKTLVDVYAV